MDAVRLKAEPKLFAADSERFPAIGDDDEPKTEELIEMLRESLEDVKAGRTRHAREIMRELRQMISDFH